MSFFEGVFPNTYLTKLPTDLLINVLTFVKNDDANKYIHFNNLFNPCDHCKKQYVTLHRFNVDYTCDCCYGGYYVSLCTACLKYKYDHVPETRKHKRFLTFRARSKIRRYAKRTANRRAKVKTNVDFVDFADLFS